MSFLWALINKITTLQYSDKFSESASEDTKSTSVPKFDN